MTRTPRALALSLLALTACTAAIAQAPPAPRPMPKKPVILPPNVVARVNGKDITAAEALARFAEFGGQPFVQQMVSGLVIEQEAKRLGITVTNAEVNKAVKDAKDQAVEQAMMQGTPMTFAEIAQRDGITEGRVRYTVRLNLLSRKTFTKAMEKEVPPLESQAKLAHILILTIPKPGADGAPANPTPEEQTKREAEAKTRIDEILADIKAGKITFEEAAKKYSDDSGPDGKGGSAAQGGALPYYAKQQLDPAFADTGWKLTKSGEISAPVKSQFGWHIIKLLQKGSDAPAAEKKAYKEQQLARLTSNQQAYQQWLNTLVQGASVNMNPGVRIPVGTAVPSKPTAKPAGTPTKKTASR